MQTKIHFLNSLVRPRLTYNCQTWPLPKAQAGTLNASYVRYLRELLRNGTSRKPGTYSMVLTNKEVYKKTKTVELGCFISDLQQKFIARIVRAPNSNQNKMLLFNQDKNTKRGRKPPNLFEQVLKTRNQSREEFCRDAMENRIWILDGCKTYYVFNLFYVYKHVYVYAKTIIIIIMKCLSAENLLRSRSLILEGFVTWL